MSEGDPHAAVQATVTKFLSLADGTLRLQVDVHHRDTSKALDVLCQVGAPVALARLVDGLPEGRTADEERATSEGREPEAAKRRATDHPVVGAAEPAGRDALTGKILASFYRSGFWQAPKVLEALGPDWEFLDWCRNQPACWHCGTMGSPDLSIVPAHVRRVAAGAGTSTKPKYSAIPLCNTCHAIQHTVGESGLAPSEWWESNAAKAREEWGHMKLRAKFGTDSVSASVTADDLYTWLKIHRLLNYVSVKLRRQVQQRQRAAASGSAGGVGGAAVVEG